MRPVSLGKRQLLAEMLESRDLMAVDAQFIDGLLKLDADPRDMVIVGASEGSVTINGEQILEGSVKASSVERIHVQGIIHRSQVELPPPGIDFERFQTYLIAEAASNDPDLLPYYADALLGPGWQERYGWSVDVLREMVEADDWETLLSATELGKRVSKLEAKDAQVVLDELTQRADLPMLDVYQLWASPDIVVEELNEFNLRSPLMAMSSGCPSDTEGATYALWGVTENRTLVTSAYEHATQLELMFLSTNLDHNGANLHFEISPTGELSFASGSVLSELDVYEDGGEGGGVTRYLPLYTVDDDVSESTESIGITLTVEPDDPPADPCDDQGTASGGGSTSLSIKDDDPKLSISDVQVTEKDADEGFVQAIFNVTLQGTVDYDVRVFWTTVDGPPGQQATAFNDADYVAASGYFNISSNGTHQIIVNVTGDNYVEQLEEFFVYLTVVSGIPVTNGLGPADGVDLIGECVITDDDAPISVQVSSATGREADPIDGNPFDPIVEMTFTLTLSESVGNSITVDWGTTTLLPFGLGNNPSAASAGSDYDPIAPFQVTFATRQTTRQVKVRVKHDNVPEFTEYFSVFVNNLLGATSGIDGQNNKGLGTIKDDDAPDALPNPDGDAGGGGGGMDESEQPCDCSCDCGDTTTTADAASGDVRTTVDAGPATLTNATLNNPHPNFAFEYRLPELNFVDYAGYTNLTGIVAKLTFNGVAAAPVYFARPTSTQIAPGEVMRFVIPFDATSFPTGTYDWSLDLDMTWKNDSTNDAVVWTISDTGKRSVTNRIDSEFGNRWSLDGLDRLVVQGDVVTWTRSNLPATYFVRDPVTNTFASRPSFFETLVKNGNGTYTLIYPTGERMEFSSIGLLSERVDRVGNEWAYAYIDADGDSVTDEISSITDPTGEVTTFIYTGGYLSKIVDHAGRETLIDIQNGLLLSVTSPDPDPNDPAVLPLVTSYEYDPTTKLLTKITRETDETTTYEYDDLLRVEKIIHHDSTFTLMRPQGVDGAPNANNSPTNPAAFLWQQDNEAFGIVGKANVTDELGKIRTESYDRFGRPIVSTDPLGNQTKYIRDINGLVIQMTLPDPDGSGTEYESLIVKFTHDSHGNTLTRREYKGSTALAPAQVWTYDPVFSQVTSYTDEMGRVTLFQIDSATGNVLEERHIVGTDDRTSSETDDVFMSFVYTTLSDGVPVGMLKQVTDANGNVTKYEFYTDADRKGLLKKEIYAFGTADEAEVEYFYDATTRDLIGFEDELDRRTDYAHDALGRVTTMTLPAANVSDPRAVYTYVYCNCGRLRKVIAPNGGETEWIYDDRNRLEELREPDPDGNGPLERAIWHYTYTDRGELETVIDPGGHVTEYVYDDAGRMTRRIDPDPDGPSNPLTSPETVYAYDFAGRLQSVTDPMGFVTDYKYDDRWRVERIVQPSPDGVADRPVWVYTYNASNQQTSVTDPEAALSNDSRVTRYEYDALGRQSKMIGPDPDLGNPKLGSETRYEYDKAGNIRFIHQKTSDTTNDERTTQRVYDARNRLIQTIEPDPDGNGPLSSSTTTMTYDAASQLRFLEDGSGNVTEWVFDDRGQVKEEIDPNGQSRHHVYDLMGNLTKRTDRNGRVTEYYYDLANRLRFEGWVTSPGVYEKIMTWEYDVEGRLTLAADDVSALYPTYDDLDRLTGSGQIVITGSLVLFQNEYDASSRRTSQISYHNGQLDYGNTYAYDNLNRVTSITQQSLPSGRSVTDKHVTFGYNKAGQLMQLDRYEATSAQLSKRVVATDYDYDEAGRLVESSNDAILSGSPFLYSTLFSYEYDRLNRLTSASYNDLVINAPTDDVMTYSYDRRDQLLGTTHTNTTIFGSNESYEYDDTGNRTESYLHGTGYVTDDDNRLTSDGTYSYKYDNEGNLTEKWLGAITTGTLVARYTWDYRNRLFTVEIFDETTGDPVRLVANLYDTFNRRIARLLDEGADETFEDIDNYYYDGDDVVLVLDENGNVDHRYLHGPAVDMMLADEAYSPTTHALEDVYWTVADRQGSVRDVLTFNGTHASVHEQIAYDAYGRIAAVYNGSTLDSTLTPTVAYAYTGREWDAMIGMQYSRARWYIPELGKWASKDPIGFEAGDANLYRYVSNSPTNATDPYGLEDWAIIEYPMAAGRGVYIGMSEVGRAATYPLRWCGADFSEQDAALNAYKRQHMGDSWASDWTRYTASFGVGTLYSAGLLEGAASAGISEVGTVTLKQLPKQVLFELYTYSAGFSLAELSCMRNTTPVEQGRDVLGRFLPKQQGQLVPGSTAEQSIWNAIASKPGWTVIRGRVYVSNSTGQVRVYDGVAISPNGRYIGIEVKSGCARPTTAQRAFDIWLNSDRCNKASGIGRHNGLLIDRALEIRK